MQTIRISLVGPNLLFREGLRRLLCPPQFEVASDSRDFEEIDQLASAGTAPDVVIIDASGGIDSDLEALQQVRDCLGSTRIVFLTSKLQINQMVRVLKAGADGYLLNQLSPDCLSLCLMLVMRGEKVLPGNLATLLSSEFNNREDTVLSGAQRRLTSRERQILQCLLRGQSNKLIARSLDITEGTVKVHLKALMKKIDANNRTQAALWARNHGFAEVQAEAGAA